MKCIIPNFDFFKLMIEMDLCFMYTDLSNGASFLLQTFLGNNTTRRQRNSALYIGVSRRIQAL